MSTNPINDKIDNSNDDDIKTSMDLNHPESEVATSIGLLQAANSTKVDLGYFSSPNSDDTNVRY